MQPKARDRARQDGPLGPSVLREARVATSRTTKRSRRPGICRAFSRKRDRGVTDFGQEENLQIEIDRDGEIPVEMARRLLWEHQGIEFPGDIPWYLQPQRPASPARERSRATWKSAPREEPFGLSSWESLQAVYQVLREEMQQELEQDRLFFLENPNRVHMVRASLPLGSAVTPRESAHTGGTGHHPRRRDGHRGKGASARAAAAATAASGHGRRLEVRAIAGSLCHP